MNWITQLLQGFAKPFQWWIVIAPWEQGIRVRFGRTTALLRAGIHFRIPFLDRVYRISTRLRMVKGRALTMTTKDGQIATVGVSVQFEVLDARKMFESVSNPEYTLLTMVRASVAGAISGVDRCDMTHSFLQKAATTGVPSEAWGLGSVVVRITDLAFVRTYRLLSSNEYEDMSGLDGMLAKQEQES